MPHGSTRVGGVEIVALCDAVVTSSSPGSAPYPEVTEAVWAEARERSPNVFADDGRWRLHVHCFVVRSQGRTFLVDTGVGPVSAPAFAWSGIAGTLDGELAAAGVDPAEIRQVLITHVHDDHLGWNVSPTGAPTFPNARYMIHAADWDLMANATDEEHRAIFAAVLEPLERSGVLERSGDQLPLTGELTLVHAPGHTPGHQMVVVDSGGARALLSGDLVNHPAQLLQPGLAAASDGDPTRAKATRAAWLERIGPEGWLVAPAHFPEPFGRFAPEGERHVWEPA